MRKYHNPIHVSTLYILLVILGMCIFISYFSPPIFKKSIAVGNTVTFTPTVIPLSAPEIGNPGRGPEYYGGEAPPPNWPQTDVYVRPCWSDLEKSEGTYDFSIIEQALAKAKQQGGMGGFRIMSLNTSNSGSCVPHYLQALMPKGWTSGNNYIPDWNDPNYIARGKALFQALAAKYANDPRLGWIDMSLYGNWSEWHTYPLNYPGPTGAQPGTDATLQAIIDFQTQAFPNTRFLMLTANSFALNYALNLNRPKLTGMRRDCLGVETLTFTPSDWWKKAPIFGEYCGNPNFQKGLNDVIGSHISMIGDGDGNLNSFGSYNSSDQNLMIQTYKTSGYRFILDNLTIPSQIGAGSGFSVTSNWSNVNIAPAYLPWNIMIQLRSGNTLAWQGKSSLDLQSLLPTTINGSDTPVSVTDNFTLPSTIANGSYTISVQIVDPNNYYPPLQLAIQGKQSDGSYLLGTVSVVGSPSISVPLTSSITPTISPGNTKFNITVCPHGLGNCGDNVNPLSGGNLNPLHTIRSIKLSITDTNNLPVSGSPFSGNVTYVPSAKDYQGIITIPNLSDGQFLFTVKMDGFLGKQVPGIVDVKTGQQINLAEVLVTNGDINNDNQLDIEDYNILISCYDMKYSTSSCPLRSTSQSPGADIDDDGTVNGSDYNS